MCLKSRSIKWGDPIVSWANLIPNPHAPPTAPAPCKRWDSEKAPSIASEGLYAAYTAADSPSLLSGRILLACLASEWAGDAWQPVTAGGEAENGGLAATWRIEASQRGSAKNARRARRGTGSVRLGKAWDDGQTRGCCQGNARQDW